MHALIQLPRGRSFEQINGRMQREGSVETRGLARRPCLRFIQCQSPDCHDRSSGTEIKLALFWVGPQASWANCLLSTRIPCRLCERANLEGLVSSWPQLLFLRHLSFGGKLATIRRWLLCQSADLANRGQCTLRGGCCKRVPLVPFPHPPGLPSMHRMHDLGSTQAMLGKP